jgi:formate/nitrite transporter FocA (FNT family)
MVIDLDEAKVKRNEFGLWLEWTLATAGGMLIGFLLTIPLVNLLDLGFARVIVPILAGALIGFSQWIVLRRYLTTSADWVLAGGTAWAVGYALGLLLIQNLSGTLFGGVAAYFLFGAIVALVQWPMLRREIPSLLTWIVVNILGWAAGLWASQATLTLLFNEPAINPVLSTVVIAGSSGLVAGGITGLALVWIARQPEKAA